MADKVLRLLGSEEIAEGTRLFHLERPQGFDYIPGQTIDLALIDPQQMDADGPVRTFSLVSAPHEAELEFATRIRGSAFKRIVSEAEPGLLISWDGPYGSFTLHKNATKPAVFLAGGIGITPFMSMLKQVAHDKLPHQICLFHSNNRPEDAPFQKELRQLSNDNPNIIFVSTMTAMAKSSQSWRGEEGRINKAMIDKYLPDSSSAIFYIAGPQTFVTGMRSMLASAGIDEDTIRFEEFPGY